MIRKIHGSCVAHDAETGDKPVSAFNKNMKTYVIVIGCVAVIGCASLALFAKGSPVRILPQGGVSMSANDVQSLINKVAAHITIKTDEKPTVATIQDAAILRAQNPDFYKDAQVGDRLLIWSDKAVLYSSSKDVLLAVLPIRLPTNPVVNAAQAATVPAEHAVIEVRNGTKTTGLGKTVADRLKAAGLNAAIVSTAVGNYNNTTILVTAGKSFPQTIQRLQQLTGGKLAILPAKEGALKGDILVIIGADYKK